jgi:hypothetical protein
MTALGVGVSSREPVIGWEAIQPVINTARSELAILKDQYDFALATWKETTDAMYACEDDAERNLLYEKSCVDLIVMNSIGKKLATARRKLYI